MKVKHYAQENQYAVTDTDEHGPVVIEWHIDDKPTGAACDGWIEGEGLFAPSDDQALPGDWLDEDGEPDPAGDWYHVTTGHRAVFGMPGKTLALYPI